MGSEEPKCDEAAPSAPTLSASSKHTHSSSNGLPETVPCSSNEMNPVTVPNSTEETCPNYHNNNNNNINQSKYLVIFYTVSAGLNASGLGNDEEDLVSIYYHIIDVEQNKVVDQYCYPVRPHNADLNENILSEECRNDYQISEESIQTASNLSQVLEEFHKVAQASLGGSFTLVTDGQFHIRQALFPEAYRKEIPLQDYYHQFHDLRKEFIAKYPDSSVTNVDDMLKYLGLESDSSPSLALKDVNNMAAIVQKLICDDVHFHEPERVLLKLEQGIRSRTDAVDGDCCVRARGLPWQASDQDIARFFVGLNLARGGVALCLSSQGRRNGEALVLFESPAHRDMALKRHKHHIGNRYIEVYKASGEDFINVAGGNNKEAQSFLSRGGQVIIRMRGLPYDCTAKQVTEFFESGESGCDVLDKEDGVLFVRKPDGRATGDAFVLFTEEKDAEKALQKHKEIIGSRYIELFRSTTAEVTQILNRTVEQNSNPRHGHHNNNNNHAAVAAAAAAAAALAATNVSSQLPLIPSMNNPAVLPQQMVTAGTRKDCIRLRGLPYEAGVENILEFLGEHGKNIVNQGIHMVYNAQGQPSGEAFIEMTTEHAAFQAATHRHHRNMTFGKKQRYIEVFQCSGEDMNYVLTGNSLPGVTSSSQITPSKNPYISTSAGILPPGSLSSIFPTAPPSLNGSAGQHHGTNGATNNHLPGVSVGISMPHSVSPGSSYHFNGGMVALNPMNPSPLTSHPPPPPPPSSHHAHHRANPYVYPPQFIYWPYPSPPISPASYYNGIPNAMLPNGIPPNVSHPPSTPNGSISSMSSPPIPGTPTLLTVDVVPPNPPQRGMETRMTMPHMLHEAYPPLMYTTNGKLLSESHPPPQCDLTTPPPTTGLTPPHSVVVPPLPPPATCNGVAADNSCNLESMKQPSPESYHQTT